MLKASCPYVSQVVMLGDKRPFCVALITVNEEATAKWAKENGIASGSYGDLVSRPEIDQDGSDTQGSTEDESALLLAAAVVAVALGHAAIAIGTLNGARYLGRDARIGSIAKGKQADLIVLNGDPSTNISDIRKLDTVFRQGVGFSPAKLIDSVRGQVGLW